MMKKILYILLASLPLLACFSEGSNTSEVNNISEVNNTVLSYKNLVILSDFSSRMSNQISKDEEEIHQILEYFKNECVKPGEKIGDKSAIMFTSFSDKKLASIDLDDIKNLGDKQAFVNSTGKYAEEGLSKALNDFKEKVAQAYASNTNQGLDLISVLVDKIANDALIKSNTHLTNGIDTTFIQYDNHIYIFTDGYLEYGNKSMNNQFYFGKNEIKNVRKYCQEHDVSVATALNQNPALSLKPVKNSKHAEVSLHILETHERDKNTKLLTYDYPLGLRDNEILEAVWRKWAMDSGFKSLEWKKY